MTAPRDNYRRELVKGEGGAKSYAELCERVNGCGDELANDPALNLMMEFQRGDMQFVNNHTILHDRTAFEDFPEPER